MVSPTPSVGILDRHLRVVDGVHVEVDEDGPVLVGDGVEGERRRHAHPHAPRGDGGKGEAEVADRLPLAGIEVAEAEQRDVVGLAAPAAVPIGATSSSGPRPRARDRAIPLRKPEGVVSGVLRSALASM